MNWEFIRAAEKFQDTEDHVFWFGATELCPTIEEFSAILGYEFNKKSMAFTCDPKDKVILSNALGLSVSITSSMIKGHMVNLYAVVTRFIHRNTRVISNNMQKNFALVLCFMREFLLCSRRPSFMDAQAIGIVDQFKDGDNPASLILGETFLGLDSIFLGGESHQFLGCPLTLQMLLIERMDMIATPTYRHCILYPL